MPTFNTDIAIGINNKVLFMSLFWKDKLGIKIGSRRSGKRLFEID